MEMMSEGISKPNGWGVFFFLKILPQQFVIDMI